MSSEVKVFEVPIEHTVQLWPDVEKFIAESLQHSDGELTADEARVYVVQGLWSLIGVFDAEHNLVGALVIQYFNRVRDRVAFVVAFGGKNILYPETFQQFSAILKTNGATCIEGGVRYSVSRLLRRYGFIPKYRIVKFSF
jgi:hypothetical protein